MTRLYGGSGFATAKLFAVEGAKTTLAVAGGLSRDDVGTGVAVNRVSSGGSQREDNEQLGFHTGSSPVGRLKDKVILCSCWRFAQWLLFGTEYIAGRDSPPSSPPPGIWTWRCNGRPDKAQRTRGCSPAGV